MPKKLRDITEGKKKGMTDDEILDDEDAFYKKHKRKDLEAAIDKRLAGTKFDKKHYERTPEQKKQDRNTQRRHSRKMSPIWKSLKAMSHPPTDEQLRAHKELVKKHFPETE